MKYIKILFLALAVFAAVGGGFRFGWQVGVLVAAGEMGFGLYLHSEYMLDVGEIIEWYEDHRDELLKGEGEDDG